MARGCVSEGGNFLWPGVRAGYNVTIEAQGPSGEAVVMTTLSLQPRIFSISPLLADFESEAIISQAAPIMVASPVMVRTNKQSAADRAKSAAKRTSTQARLPLGGNTVSAHRIACENITVAPLLGGFRGGADLRGRRSDHQWRSRFD